MAKHLLLLMLSSLFGGIGWWLGDFFHLTAALALSTIASVYGFYLAWQLNAEYLE